MMQIAGTILQMKCCKKEKLIDPGNEHNHHSGPDSSAINDWSEHDADAGGDGTGTMDSKPE